MSRYRTALNQLNARLTAVNHATTRNVLTSIGMTVMLVVIAVAGCTAAVQLAGANVLEAARPTTSTPTAVPGPTPTPQPTTPLRPAPTRGPTTNVAKTTSTTKTSGIEVWNLAPGGTGEIGTGTKALIQYRVEVEQATGLKASAVAAIVDETLADARGWTNEGWHFQRVTLPISQVDMVVRVATPATVDKICARYGMLTGGTVSCRGGKYVMINLTRWNTGVTAYAGDVAGYRHLVLNHEIGHLLGHHHVQCPGPGLPEPVMMQVVYTGLEGCVKNAWPYATDGTFIG